MTAPLVSPSRLRPAGLMAVLILALAGWTFWPAFVEMTERWAHDPQYSQGYLVPLFAVYLLWLRRQRLTRHELRPAVWGLGLIALAAALYVAGAGYLHYPYLGHVAILPCLAGIAALAGGRAALVWAWPAVAFLAFMVPLPESVSLAMSGPMQTIATLGSTFVLQVLGRPAIAEGNVIQLNEIPLNIVEACSGLRMLVVFFALSTAVALLMRKPLWERCLIAFSALPIALLSNILRIAITGICFEILGEGYGGKLFHDVAGWLMMPLGLMFLGIEMLILKKLLIDPAELRAAPQRGATRRVDVSPVSLYRSERSARRERRTVTAPPAAAAVPEPSSQAPPEPTPESVARS